MLGRALLNLADAVTATDPAAGAEAARTAAAHLRRTGDWDTAQAELEQALDRDGLADIEFLACNRAWVAALRGASPTAQAVLGGLGDLRASEDPQHQAVVAVAEAFTAASRREPTATLRCTRAVLSHAGAPEISHASVRWARPLAARAAHDLADTATTTELLALLDGYQPGQLAPMQRAEHDLARARLTAADGAPADGAAFTAAITGLRQHSTPYHPVRRLHRRPDDPHPGSWRAFRRTRRPGLGGSYGYARTATVRCAQDGQLLRLSDDDFQWLVQTQPAVRAELAKILADRLRQR